jgi:hypothetical protein
MFVICMCMSSVRVQYQVWWLCGGFEVMGFEILSIWLLHHCAVELLVLGCKTATFPHPRSDTLAINPGIYAY